MRLEKALEYLDNITPVRIIDEDEIIIDYDNKKMIDKGYMNRILSSYYTNGSDDYLTYEIEVEDVMENIGFDYKQFFKDIYKWRKEVEHDLEEDNYDLKLLCIDAVLETVIGGMIMDNIKHELEEEYFYAIAENRDLY